MTVPATARQARERLTRATDALIEATHVGEPWQVSAAQREWDEALAALASRLEQAERALRVIASNRIPLIPYGDEVTASHEGKPAVAQYVKQQAPSEYAASVLAKLSEEPRK